MWLYYVWCTEAVSCQCKAGVAGWGGRSLASVFECCVCWKINGKTLLEGVCIRLRLWHLHNHDMTYVMNMKEVVCMFVTTVIKCHSLNYDIFNANMTLFEMFLLWQLDKPIHHNLSVSLSWQRDITMTTQPVINMT